ncbi:receptor kinase-like protein Xa21 [Rhodamnia argentea]|uniref:Receptor kinase-like protein Xa21 n=1 Tax=Rhodamnia argentea TaxID=178133 RepID=A0ABM3GYX4_9MYRT|nr:receptor kinase-like protein Xa21 [Rhodamnia argentea]
MQYMPYSNLEKWLYPEDKERDASAMDCLHPGRDPLVVYCYLKPGNVLLDDHMVAHVGEDVRLALFLRQTQQEKSMEWEAGHQPVDMSTVSASSCSDILKKPTDQMFEEILNLRIFTSSLNDGDHKVLDIADPRLFANKKASNLMGRNVSSSHFARLDNVSLGSSTKPRNGWFMRCKECVAASIRLGLSCVAPSAKDRPSMREALARLHKIERALLGSIDAC